MPRTCLCPTASYSAAARLHSAQISPLSFNSPCPPSAELCSAGLPHTANATPRKATEHGKGEDWIVPACYIKNKAKKHLPPPLCFATAKYRGGGRRPEGLVLQKTPILSFSPPLRRKLLFLLLPPPLSLCDTRGRSVKSILTSQKRMFL